MTPKEGWNKSEWLSVIRAHILAVLVTAGILSGDASAQTTEEKCDHSQRFVANQIIVKFRDHTEGAHIVDQAIVGELQDDPRLNSLIRELGNAHSTPIRPAQLTSGREVLISIDFQALVENILRRLRGRDEVRSANIVESPGRFASALLRLRFEIGGEEERVLNDAWGNHSMEKVTDLVGALGKPYLFPFSYRLNNETDLLIEIDGLELTRRLAFQLNELEEVEYSELNYMANIMNAR